MHGTLCRRRAAPDPDARPPRRSRERVYSGATRPKLRNLEPRTQAHYCSAMTQTQRLLLAVCIVALAGVAANTWGPGVWRGAAACRRYAGEARGTCYSQLLSERLKHHGVADAMATLDAIAA